MSNSLIRNIKEQGQSALIKVYEQYRADFISWAIKNFTCPSAEAEDVYQDVIIAFYENISSGKLQSLNCSIKTYLYAIGKNILLSKGKKSSKLKYSGEQLPELPDQDSLILEKIQLNEKQKLMQETLANLGEPCQSILRLFYYDRLSIKQIVVELNYKSDNVVKVQKVRCMKKLRELVSDPQLKKSLGP